MMQALLYVALHVVGLAVCLAVGPHRRPALCAALGFLTGLAVLCIITLVALVLGLPHNLAVLAVLAIVTVVLAGVPIARRGIDRRTLKIVGIWTLAFSAVASVWASLNLTIMSHDSFLFVMFGRALAEDGALYADVIRQLDSWGSFHVVAHSLAVPIGEPYLYGLPPMLGLSVIPVFALTLWHGLAEVAARRRAVVVALVTAALFGNYMAIFHIFYLHTNMGSAVYLFGFVALFWLAETQEEPSLLPIAFLFLIALALQRTETPLVAMIFAALTIPTSRLPRRSLSIALAMFIIVVGGWYEFLAHYVSAESAFLTPMRCRLVWGTMVLFFGWWMMSGNRFVASVNRRLPLLIALIFALALVAAFLLRFDHMTESVKNWGNNLFFEDYWGQLWFAVVFLAGLGLLLGGPEFRHPFVIGAPVYLGFVLLLAWFRSPYKPYLDDSANRMTIHIVPVIFFYFGLKLGIGLRVVRGGASPSAELVS